MSKGTRRKTPRCGLLGPEMSGVKVIGTNVLFGE
ncbi:hypothetical protein DIKCMJMK_01947 [Shewanella oneidensis]|nr:hypothetical protein [Shewanella oneidensis]